MSTSRFVPKKCIPKPRKVNQRIAVICGRSNRMPINMKSGECCLCHERHRFASLTVDDNAAIESILYKLSNKWDMYDTAIILL